MKKQFVPYNIASKLKELGFDEECLYSFECGYGGIECKLNPNLKNNSNCYIGEITAPLWQQVIDWFREKYKYLAVTDVANEEEYFASVRKFDDCGTTIFLIPYKIYSTYQEAREQAILKAIELISKQYDKEISSSSSCKSQI